MPISWLRPLIMALCVVDNNFGPRTAAKQSPKVLALQKHGFQGWESRTRGLSKRSGACLIILTFQLFRHNNFTTDYFTIVSFRILNMMGRSWLWKGFQGVQMVMTKNWGGGEISFQYKFHSSPVLHVVAFYTKPLILMEQKETVKSNPLIVVLCVG